MVIFWRSGRGYLTALIILGALSAFGLIYPAIGPAVDDSPWYWGAAFVVAAFLNWHLGTRLNLKKIAIIKPKTLKNRLLYRTRHTFMTLPMETFSLVIIVFAASGVTYGLLGQS